MDEVQKCKRCGGTIREKNYLAYETESGNYERSFDGYCWQCDFTLDINKQDKESNRFVTIGILAIFSPIAFLMFIAGEIALGWCTAIAIIGTLILMRIFGSATTEHMG